MKLLSFVICFILFYSNSFGQKSNIDNSVNNFPEFRGSKLQYIETSIRQGNKDALFMLAPYLDSTKRLTEMLGYHILHTPEKDIAKRLLYENCTFLNSELKLDDSISYDRFATFLHIYYSAINFDNDANVFLITPFVKRDVKYEIRELSKRRKIELADQKDSLLKLKWVKENNIDNLISERNSYVLYKIAALFYKGRDSFNYYMYDAADYIKLLQILTGVEIGVENESLKIDHHIEKDYESISRLNLLIYFAKNYQFYKWDANSSEFQNPNNKVESLPIETIYFQSLTSNVDSIALNAFLNLTTCNSERVSEIADEYQRAGIEANYILPTFPYKFLKQLTILTEYCSNNHIDFKGSEQLRRGINTLKRRVSFSTRRALEDKIIKTMSIDELTAFEFWCLIFEKNDYLTYSAGRILDIYYSNHWKEITTDKRQLNIYLKKSVLFDRLGIIGICNNYLKKFANSDSITLSILKNDNSDDKDIEFEIQKAIDTALLKQPKLTLIKKTNDANYFSKVKDLKKEFNQILNAKLDSEKRDNEFASLFSRISYTQLGLALKLAENYKFENARQQYKYSFIEDDFGFFMDDFEKPTIRKDFIRYYTAHTEKRMYERYLTRAGIDYINTDHSLNYDKIYELLKYDVVTAFVGGGGGTRDNEVYALIKILEINFKTTLGFPNKLCNSEGIYGCDSSDRVKFWMSYIKDKKLLKLSHNTPISFTY